MTVFLFFLGLIQCLLLWVVGQAGVELRQKAERERELARYAPPDGWPDCALIVPVGGESPHMEASLRSLLEQNYPAFTVYLVTATADDTAKPLIDKLCREYTHVSHVIAGLAEKCGQKNFNLLAGVRAAGDKPGLYVFCDSTHQAEPDFLRCLTGPIARHEAAFCTGYHEVVPQDAGIVTLGYALSVMFMRFLQGMSIFTQPWGGALASGRHAFERYRVASLWETNVVDDCSLASWLRKEGGRIHHCAGALLRTMCARHALPVWGSWLERQILFLKFCARGEWLGLGLTSLLLVIPPIWCAIACLGGIFGLGGGMAPFLALCWLWLISWVIGGWRRLAPGKPPFMRWLWAFFCACVVFALVYGRTILTRSIVWRNIRYNVGANGVVTGIERH